MSLTIEQQAVVDSQFEHILLVIAYAGAGKTSTLVKFCEKRHRSRILYLAYNSSMVKEASHKFKHISSVNVKTMHSLAYRSIVNDNIKERLGNLRALDLIGYCSDVPSDKERFYYSHMLLRLIREFCNTEFTMDEYVLHLSDQAQNWHADHNIRIDYFVRKLPMAWEQIIKDPALPYEHDFYLKQFQLSKPVLDYDYILVDEAQDINGCVIDIVMRQTNAKKVFIGDTYQSIYKFRGASNSLEKLAQLPDSLSLYLTQSWRCPRSIAHLANDYLSLLKAPKPFRGTKPESRVGSKQNAVIARTNAKLFEYAVENRDKKLFFVGGINSYNFQDLVDIQNIQWGKTEYVRNEFLQRFYDMSELVSYAADANEVDLNVKIQTVRMFMKLNIRLMLKELKENAVKKESEADIILTTGHKSKGLEWDNVEILDDFPNLRKMAEDEALDMITISREEIHLIYVAITRSKLNLYVDEDYILDQDFIDSIAHRLLIT